MRQDIKRESIVVLEASLDDATGETMGYAMERVMEAGALDVYLTPLYMKKNRPAVLLTVLCRPKDKERLASLILKETPTLGLRTREEERYVLPRESTRVDLGYGSVGIKKALCDGDGKASPEYEDCAALARKTGKPLREIMEDAISAYRERHKC